MTRVLVVRVVAVALGAFVFWLALGMSGASRACAHDPRFACSPRDASHAVAISDARKSWAFYGDLAPGEADVYRFDLARAANVPVSLLVDERDASNPGRPVASIEAIGAPFRERIDFSRTRQFYEPFSRERYITTPDRNLSLPAGRYALRVTMQGKRVNAIRSPSEATNVFRSSRYPT